MSTTPSVANRLVYADDLRVSNGSRCHSTYHVDDRHYVEKTALKAAFIFAPLTRNRLHGGNTSTVYMPVCMPLYAM